MSESNSTHLGREIYTPAVVAGRVVPMDMPEKERRLVVQKQLFDYAKEQGLPTDGEVRYVEYGKTPKGLKVEAVLFVDWLRLLVEEFGGNKEAAEVAWALGQRPAGHPEVRNVR